MRKAAGLDRRGWGTWLEAEALLDEWLSSHLPVGVQLYTHMSNVSDGPFYDPQVIAPLVATTMLAKLLGLAADAVTYYAEASAQGWVCWSPDSREDMARLVQGFRK